MEILKIRKDEALRYMGFKDNKPDDGFMELVFQVEKELLSVCNPKYTYKIFDIKEISKNNNEVILRDCSFVLKGRDITNHLKDCDKAVFMACTASAEVDKLMRVYSVSDMTRAVICDSMASALVEQICDEAQKEISERINGYTTWRYSCGYGDFPLDAQRDISLILDTPKTIGVSVTDSCLMTPLKSVSAVFGISKNPFDKKRLSCESCNMFENCNYRKRGERCEF